MNIRLNANIFTPGLLDNCDYLTCEDCEEKTTAWLEENGCDAYCDIYEYEWCGVF